MHLKKLKKIIKKNYKINKQKTIQKMNSNPFKNTHKKIKKKKY